VSAEASDPGDPLSRQFAAANASAGQGVASVAEIRAQQAAEDEAAAAEFRQIFAQARAALDAGKPNVAKIYFQQIARRASGSQKQQALAALKSLDSTPNSAASKSASPAIESSASDGQSR
jgi:DNA-binding PucR family transcriptional regulator